MAKYIIHSCNERQWYVDKYLVPSMLDQGIKKEDIIVHQDKERIGNLKSFIITMSILGNQPGGTWHLQDDVLICRDFKKRTEQLDEDIVCGFCNSYDYDEALADNRELAEGETTPKNMWFSFQCIRIPNDLAKKFVRWFKVIAVNDGELIRKYICENRHDDTLFRLFVRSYHPTQRVYTAVPNLVEHVDDLIGGSVVNSQRGKRNVRSIRWEDEELTKELEEKLNASS